MDRIRHRIERIRALGFEPLVGSQIGPEEIMAELACLDMDGLPLIPDDYADFLLEFGSGFAWNGRVFYGTQPLAAPTQRLIADDIHTVNRRCSACAALRGKLVLGHGDDTLYVYDDAASAYEVVDRVGMDTLAGYRTFAELFQAEV